MKTKTLLALALAFLLALFLPSTLLGQGCGQLVLNPLTGQFDCAGTAVGIVGPPGPPGSGGDVYQANPNVFTRGQTINGTKDEVQWDITCNILQTTPCARIRKSDGTVLFEVNNDGSVLVGSGTGPLLLNTVAAPGGSPNPGTFYLWPDSSTAGFFGKDSNGNQYQMVPKFTGSITDWLRADGVYAPPTGGGGGGGCTDTIPWTPVPALLHGWTNTSPGPVAQYKVDCTGRIHTQGKIAPGTTTNGTVLFTLPSGSRPTYPNVALAYGDNTSGVEQLTFNGNGDVAISGGSAPATFVDLNGGSAPTGASTGTCAGYTNSGIITLHPPAGVTAAVNNFPVRLSGTYGGHLSSSGGMQNANAYDQCFADPTNTTPYPLQIHRYDATLGVYETVTAPILAANPTTTQIGIWWGKAGVSVNPSTSTVWDTSFAHVYILQENGLNYLNSGQTTGADLTSGTIPVRATGPLVPGFVQTFTSASSQYLQGVSKLPTGSTPTFTLSVFAKVGAGIGTAALIDVRGSTTSDGQVFYTDNVHMGCFMAGSSGFAANGAIAVNDGNWHYSTCQWDTASSKLKIYVDGVLDVTSGGASPFPYTVGHILTIGDQADHSANYFGGQIGEVRISSIPRSTSFDAATGANFVAPTTFITFP